jgi:hypothetical protein
VLSDSAPPVAQGEREPIPRFRGKRLKRYFFRVVPAEPSKRFFGNPAFLAFEPAKPDPTLHGGFRDPQFGRDVLRFEASKELSAPA